MSLEADEDAMQERLSRHVAMKTIAVHNSSSFCEEN